MWGGTGPVHAAGKRAALVSAQVSTRQLSSCECAGRGVRGGHVPREPGLEPFSKTRFGGGGLDSGTREAAFEGFELGQPGIRFALTVTLKQKQTKKQDEAEADVGTCLPLKMIPSSNVACPKVPPL